MVSFLNLMILILISTFLLHYIILNSDFTFNVSNVELETITFGVCKTVKTPCEEGNNTFATANKNGVDTCKRLTSDLDSDVTKKLLGILK